MERVAFLIEETGERLGCLLNPDGVVVRRTAGVRPRRTIGGTLTGAGRTEDPVLYTGGGRTELTLDLLFDVSLAGSTITSTDVRDLTAPLWRLSENTTGDDGYGHLRTVRFVWGKAWNVPGVITAVAERLEWFDSLGAPRRSWLRLRLLKVEEAQGGAAVAPMPSALGVAESSLTADGRTRVLEVGGGPWKDADAEALGEPEAEGVVSRPDNWAFFCWRDSGLWRLLLSPNGIEDPFHVPAGERLVVPAEPAQEAAP